MYVRSVLCLLVAGCFPIIVDTGTGSDTGTDTGSTPTLPSGCDPNDPNRVTSIVGDGIGDEVLTTWDVMIDLAYAEEGVEIVTTDSTGAVVPTQIFSNGQSYSVFPLVSWDGSTTYDFAVTHSCGTEHGSVTSAPTLRAIPPPSSTWAIDLGGWSMNEHVILPELVRLDGYPLAIEVISSTTATLDLRLAATHRVDAGTAVQDLCTPTLEVLGVPFDRNPSFRVEGPLPLTWQGDLGSTSAVLQDGFLAMTFGDSAGARLGGIVDTTVLDPVFDAEQFYMADLCDAADVYGSNCETCPDGAPTCLPTGGYLHLATIEMPSLSLVPRTALEISADPTCP